MRLSLLIGFIAAFLAVSVQAELVHRYTFNNNVLDSVGTAHGTLVLQSIGASYSNGLLYLGNSEPLLSNEAVNYVDLPNGIISSLGTGMTIETWACWFGPAGTVNQRLFIFGSGDSGENKSSASVYSDFMMLSVERFTNRNSIATGESTPTHVYFDADLPTNTMIHLAVTWDDTKGIASLYKNGQLVGSCPTRLRLSELNDINNWLGRDIWLGVGFYGAYSDLRIYNTPLTAEMIQASYAAGANPEAIEIEHVLPTCISPADNSASAASCTELNWQPDSNSDIVSQNVYFGSDLTGVLQADATSTEYFLGNISGTATSIGLPYTLEAGKTYYWRIEEVTTTGYSYSGPLWSYTMLHKPVSCLPNDLSGDCQVDIGDLAVLCQQWLESVNCSDYDCADLTSDGIVNLEDFVALQENWNEQADPLIVINEIHYHSDYNKDLVEFVELYHAGAAPVDLSGWTISDGISYTFPAGTVLNPNTYITVCQEPTSFFNKFGIICYGPFEGKLSNEGETITLRDAQGNKIDEVTYTSEFPWPIAANGEGASMELINPYLDNDLAASWRSSGLHYDLPYRAFRSPTPGARNHSFTFNIPPQIRQVQNSPEAPVSNTPVIITAKITDAEGVDSVTLKYQIVTAGNYIPAFLPVDISTLYDDPVKYPVPNPEFEDPANWTAIAMVDNGSGSDIAADDDVYTAVIPAQANRTLVRYRIETSDTVGNQVQVPYFDDESLNFAYYIYDGIPDYVTTDNSVSGAAGYTYPSDMLKTFPVYSLITRSSDFTMCNGNNSADRIYQDTTEFANQETGRRYNWEGAFVYEGKVYDHIGYRLRGGNGRYNYGMGGKRSMKFRFNRGNYFQARDIYGDKFPSKWQHLNSGKMFGNKISGGYRNYAYGINEIMDMRLFAQAGVPSPETWWFHFRVVDGAEETPSVSGGQYTGDFYGLYIGFENYDGAMLDRLGLPDGNLYKLADKVFDGKEQQRYQGPYSVDNAGDYTNIRYNLNHTSTAEFIDKYLDCEQWYRYHTITEAIRHYDIFSGSDCWHCLKNCTWYFLPVFDENNQYGKLWYLPFDVDDTWGPYWNMGVDHAKAAIYDQRYLNNLEQFTVQPAKEPFKIAYRNYIREFRDLHWQPEVIDGMIDELAWLISDFVPADRDRWRRDTTGGGSAIDNGLLATNVAIMKQFAWSSGVEGWMGSNTNLDNLANAEGDSVSIPATPAISYIGTEGYPENDLRFSASAFSDPQGAGTFGAMKWRIAEYNLGFNSYEPSSSATISLLEKESNWKYFKGNQEPSTQTGAWRLAGFNDSNWLSGQTPIGYNDPVNTVITDMRNNYTTMYLRNSFFVANAANVSSLTLNAMVDDGCIVWINGIEVARLYCSAGEKAYNSTTGVVHHEADYYEQITLNNPSSFLVNGENTIAVQVIQVDINSSDLAIDIELQANVGGYTHKRLSKNVKYEIDPVYESSDLTIYSSDYQFPAEGIKPGRNYRVRCKMMDNTGRWSHWSAPIEFVAGEALGSDIKNYFRLTELMYNNGEADFIEFQNISSNITLDLSTISIEGGVTFSFANSSVTTLAPGEFVLVVRDKTAFATAYGTDHNSRIAGKYSGKLDNAGEDLKISDYWNGTIIEFEYNDGRGWPVAADGSGHSLVPIDDAIEDEPLGTLDYGANWRASSYIGGSPAATDPAEPTSSLLINEFMAHTDFTSSQYPGYDSNDWIELFNCNTSAVNIDNNWYLSDDISELDKWALPASVLAGKSFISYDEITGFHSPLSTGFGLDKAGEKLYLSYLPGIDGQDRIVDAISFAGQLNNVSLGRYPDGSEYWLNFNNGTRGATNSNPIDHILISEIMYHPASDDVNHKYIEIYNPTASAVNLWSQAGAWQFEGGIDFTFPTGKVLAPGQRILVVGFDPTNSTALNSFQSYYSSTTLVVNNIFGPWSGSLSNNSDRITLATPQSSDDPLDPLAISLVTIDQCYYNDYWPWPSESDGSGKSLQRASYGPQYSGDDPENWIASDPSPGS